MLLDLSFHSIQSRLTRETTLVYVLFAQISTVRDPPTTPARVTKRKNAKKRKKEKKKEKPSAREQNPKRGREKDTIDVQEKGTSVLENRWWPAKVTKRRRGVGRKKGRETGVVGESARVRGRRVAPATSRFSSQPTAWKVGRWGQPPARGGDKGAEKHQ